MILIRDQLTTGPGFVLLENLLSDKSIDDFNNRSTELYPVRASSSNKKYAEREAIKELEDISVWWSQIVLPFKETREIESVISTIITENFPLFSVYSGDVVCINPQSKWINPHVDTPHRFEKYNFDRRLLGIQCIIALDDITIDSGATGVVPYSQKRDFDINKCYTGVYDRWFTENCKQFNMTKGSVVLYNCRVLHSSMPNKTDKVRAALLLNYCDNSIINEITELDNIWRSNNG